MSVGILRASSCTMAMTRLASKGRMPSEVASRRRLRLFMGLMADPSRACLVLVASIHRGSAGSSSGLIAACLVSRSICELILIRFSV